MLFILGIILISCGSDSDLGLSINNDDNINDNTIIQPDLSIVFADANGSAVGDGSQNYPMTLTDAIESGADVIVLLDTDGPISANAVLRPGQYLIGGGDLGIINIDLTPTQNLSLSGLGGRPSLIAISDPLFLTYPISVGTDNYVQGISIEEGSSGIFCGDESNLELYDLIITNAEYHGIELSNCDNVRMNDIRIEEIQTWSGIDASFSDDLVINNINFNTTADPFYNLTNKAIDIDNSNNVIINNVYINDADTYAIQIANVADIELSNVVTDGSAWDSIYIDGDNVSLTNITVENSGGYGIIAYAQQFFGENLLIKNVATDAIYVLNTLATQPSNLSLNNVNIDTAINGVRIALDNDSYLNGTNNTAVNVTTKCIARASATIVGNITIDADTCF